MNAHQQTVANCKQSTKKTQRKLIASEKNRLEHTRKHRSFRFVAHYEHNYEGYGHACAYIQLKLITIAN